MPENVRGSPAASDAEGPIVLPGMGSGAWTLGVGSIACFVNTLVLGGQVLV